MPMQTIKDYLVRQGPDSILVHAALALYAHRRNFKIRFSQDCVSLLSGDREMILHKRQFVEVPIMMECYELFFETIDAEVINGHAVLDFSKPRIHRYKKSGAEFEFPAIPEDDVMDAYTHWYLPKTGDIIWDAGAYAGATSYFLAQLVGPDGKVYAFEPDEVNYGYLVRNIERHQLTNVIPVKKALAGSTGTTVFHLDGTMSSGIREYIVYPAHFGGGRDVEIPTLTIADACEEFREVPSFIKMDIEGAEVAVIEGAAAFLETCPINFAIESYHRIGNEHTCKALDRLFPKLGYEVCSSPKFGQMFTWARKRNVGLDKTTNFIPSRGAH